MADQLTLYNSALGLLKERKVGSLTENREPRRVLDDYWTDVVNYCLEQGLWRFATRVAQVDASTTIVPAFGFSGAFSIPVDWIRTVLLSTSDMLDPPLLQYREETGYWYANATPIYVAYVSNDPLYGWNLGQWPQSFAEYVTIRLAMKAAGRIAKDRALIVDLKKDELMARRVSKANDAMNDPPGMPPVSFWVRSRRGAFGPGGLWFGSGGGSG